MRAARPTAAAEHRAEALKERVYVVSHLAVHSALPTGLELRRMASVSRRRPRVARPRLRDLLPEKCRVETLEVFVYHKCTVFP
jgi:hypothetical protein